jgi:uncharacterized protein
LKRFGQKGMAKNKPVRIVIDTNLWISFLISNRLRKLDSLLLIEGLSILFSTELFDEIYRIIHKPKLKKHFGPMALEEMLLAFENYIEIVEVFSILTICRDPKDDFLLALAKDGRADFLLTGDKDLLEIRKIGKTEILTISNFLARNIKG